MSATLIGAGPDFPLAQTLYPPPVFWAFKEGRFSIPGPLSLSVVTRCVRASRSIHPADVKMFLDVTHRRVRSERRALPEPAVRIRHRDACIDDVPRRTTTPLTRYRAHDVSTFSVARFIFSPCFHWRMRMCAVDNA